MPTSPPFSLILFFFAIATYDSVKVDRLDIRDELVTIEAYDILKNLLHLSGSTWDHFRIGVSPPAIWQPSGYDPDDLRTV